MNHQKYMQRALQIAKNGLGTTRPNPAVGAVIVLDDKIIGEGFTSSYGKNHAEVNAINTVKDKTKLQKASIYVTLEPCAHYGKTPPCADLIAKHQLKNVFIGCVDSNSLVAGKGIEHLTKSGCNVVVGVLEAACKEHHKRFFTIQNKKRPYVILKWAETLNGFIAPNIKETNTPVWISNQYSQQLVHKWRSEEHAILVGVNTVIADNPKLNVRSWTGNNPIRIIVDPNLRTPLESVVYDKSTPAIFIVDKNNGYSKKNKNQVFFVPIDFSKNVAKQILDVLFLHKIQSVIIEGGTKTIQTFIDENLWDEARIFVGNNIFKSGIRSPKISEKRKVESHTVLTDTLKIIYND